MDYPVAETIIRIRMVGRSSDSLISMRIIQTGVGRGIIRSSVRRGKSVT